MSDRQELSPAGKARYVWRYDSLRELADVGQKTVGSSKDTARPDWHGTQSWAAARELAESGWYEGGSTLELAIERIRPQVGKAISVNNRLQFLHTCNRPGVLDVGRYATGNPYMMISPTFTATTPIVRIAVPAIWVNWMSAQDILNYGAIAATVCDVLMSAGYGVEIVAVAGWGRKNGSYVVTETVLKRSTEQLDVEDVAFGIAHPSMSRRFIFASGEQHPFASEIGCVQYGGYGGYGSQWSGTNADICGGMGDIDLTGMSKCGIDNGRRSGTDIERGIDLALDAIAKWKEGVR